MSKLWVFGDSFSNYIEITTPHYCEKIEEGCRNFGQIISEKLNLDLIINAHGGANNYDIFDSVINILERIEDDDIIIIGWTEILRHRLSDGDKWVSVSVHSQDYFSRIHKIPYFCNRSYNEILMNRSNKEYILEINNYIKILSFALKNNIIINWSWSNTENLLNSTIPFKYYATINEESEDDCWDYHYSNKGHQEISVDMLEYISNNKHRLI